MATYKLVANRVSGAGEMAQLVKYLLCKHEDLSFVRRIHVKKPGIVMHTWNPGTAAADPWGTLASLDYLMSSRAMRKSVSKEVSGVSGDATQGCLVPSTHIHTCTRAPVCTHEHVHTLEHTHMYMYTHKKSIQRCTGCCLPLTDFLCGLFGFFLFTDFPFRLINWYIVTP